MQIQEVLRQLDELFATNQMQEAEHLLTEALMQAKEEESQKKSSGEAVLILLNELTGYYRSVGRHEEAVQNAREALEQIRKLGMSESAEHGTTLVNAATALRAAGQYEASLEAYREAEQIYSICLPSEDARFAGLYNNMSLAYERQNAHEEALSCLQKALAVILQTADAKEETAATYTNLAELYLKTGQISEGLNCLEKALVLYEAGNTQDPHYAAALSACGHGYYLAGRYEEAIDSYTKALRMILDTYGENDAYAVTCENCAMVLETAGFPKEAGILREKAAHARKRCSVVESRSYERRPKSEKDRKKGIELARAYYEQFGKRMIREQFPEYADRIAVGLVGEGSECLGFDDMLSEDHDYGAAFCMWLTQEDYDKIGDRLQSAYEQLPSKVQGHKRRIASARGSDRDGVFSIPDFYENFLGREWFSVLEDDKKVDGEKVFSAWAGFQEERLAMAVNGAVFTDPLGEFSKVREHLMREMPEQLWLQKTATATAKAAQAGQYNYARCMRRGDTTAASFALWEFLQEAVHIEYLLHHTYMPYYKWAWRGMGNLSGAQEMQKRIEILANERPERDHWKAVGEVQEVNWDDPIVCQIEQISAMILERLREQKLTYGWEDFLEIHTERILKAGERMKREKTEILEAIIQLEWNMFQKVRNTGGRAGCQDDWETFYIMRKSQFTSWKKELLLSYERDLLDGESAGRNLVMEKYAYMMELTVPEEYRRIAENLPKISEEKKKLIEGIVSIQVSWREEMAGEYPQLSGQARIIHTEEDTAEDISFETYLRGELKTYSMETLVRYGQLVAEYAKAGKNMVEEIIECTVRLYGYGTMGQAEHSVGRKK